MSITSIAVLAAMSAQAAKPIFWLNPNDSILLNGNEIKPKISEGVAAVRYPAGVAYSFNGQHGGILLGDPASLKPKGALTISSYLYLRSYVNDGPGAQIFFRGDDRCGYDSYSLVLTGDRVINFNIWDENNEGMSVRSEIPLDRWIHVLASYDPESGRMEMYLNGQEAAMAYTSRRPVFDLDNGWTPGVGIGNVQNNLGPHNQPFNGVIADLRVYDTVVEPQAAGFEPGLWSESPK